jgi:hypothetical protein
LHPIEPLTPERFTRLEFGSIRSRLLARIVRMGTPMAGWSTALMPEDSSMYLVELEPGREQLYQSVEALASAIRRGEVGPEARIYHRASSTWLSITVHPAYKKIATPQATPSPPARRRWTFFGLEPLRRAKLLIRILPN